MGKEDMEKKKGVKKTVVGFAIEDEILRAWRVHCTKNKWKYRDRAEALLKKDVHKEL